MVAAAVVAAVVGPWLDLDGVPSLGGDALARLAGLAVVAVVVLLLVLQKRRARDRRPTDRGFDGEGTAYRRDEYDEGTANRRGWQASLEGRGDERRTERPDAGARRRDRDANERD